MKSKPVPNAKAHRTPGKLQLNRDFLRRLDTATLSSVQGGVKNPPTKNAHCLASMFSLCFDMCGTWAE